MIPDSQTDLRLKITRIHQIIGLLGMEANIAELVRTRLRQVPTSSSVTGSVN